MIRARSCTATSLLLGVIGVMLISSVAFSQSTPTNWEVKYLNLKDNLRALAIDPLDPGKVLIGSDLAVTATADGGETWEGGESFRTATFSVTGAVSSEVMDLLMMIEEADGAVSEEEEAADFGRDEIATQEVTESLGEVETQVAEVEEELGAVGSSVAELELELTQARDSEAAAKRELTAAETAAESWTPDDLMASEVDGESDYNKLGEWLEDRSLSIPSDETERRDDLKSYLVEHQAEGDSLKAAVVDALEISDEASARVTDLEQQLAEAEAVAVQVEAALAEAEEEARIVEEAALELPEAAGGDVVFEEEDSETELDIEASGVNYLAFDPAASETIYLAAFDGVYRSLDAGVSWEKIYTGANPSQSATLCLAIDPSNPDAIYAGTLSGLAFSLDGGTIWERASGRIANMAITRVAVHPFDSRIVMVGTVGDGIFKSTDGGEEWTQVFTRAGAQANRVLAIEFAPSQPEVIYAGTMSGIYKSLDGGESWDPATGMGISPAILVRNLIVSPINPDLVVIAADQGIFGTSNGGGLWKRLAFGTSYNNAKFLAFDPMNPSTIWLLTSSRVFKSAAPGFFDLSDGEEMTLAGCCEFTIDGQERHSIVIEEINEETGEVRLTIQSDPQTVRLKIGESTSVDLTGDGEDNLSLTLESLAGGVPRFKLVRIVPAVETAVAEEDAQLIPADQITGLEDLEPYFRAEPTWVEVQQAAGRWAEVHPDKIAAWRRGASFRALIPQMNIDFTEQNRRREDYDYNEQFSYSLDYYQRRRNETDLSEDVGQQFDTGYTFRSDQWMTDLKRRDYELEQERLRNYRQNRQTEKDGSRYQDTETYQNTLQKSWKLALRWDLGDFLFNRDQLRISTEARRLVDLRQDVVEQVTLYYFDRRTARIDMILNPPADPFSRVEMLLQIQQLDASLDAMTGGYFTQTIKERERNPRY